MLKSIDGGKTFQPRRRASTTATITTSGSTRLDPRRMIGGQRRRRRHSPTAARPGTRPPLPISQFYRINVDTPQAVSHLGDDAGPGLDRRAEQQPGSNGIALSRLARRRRRRGRLHGLHDPTDPDIVYAGEYAGVITRYDHRTRQARMVGGYVDNPSGHGAADMKYRFRWPAPIAGSPHDPKVVYHAGQCPVPDADGGQTWTPISPDLTRNDKRRQQWSGGPITGDNTTAEYYCTISAVAESPKEKGLIWVGSDDGLVHVSTRRRQELERTSPRSLPGLPEWATIKMIEPSPFDAATALVIVDAHHARRYAPLPVPDSRPRQDLALISTARCPRIFRCTSSAYDPKQKGTLYVGTERGVVFSTDDGKTWQSLQLNLPTVPVHDLIVKDDDLVVGSHGRSLWIFDDLTPIRTFGPAMANKPADLLPPLTATRWRLHGTIGAVGRGENPPSGAIIHLWLKEKPKAKPKLEILDADGKLVRTLGKPTEPEPTAVEKEGAAAKEPAGEEQEAKEKEEEPEEEEGPFGRGKPKLPDKAGPASRGLGPGV